MVLERPDHDAYRGVLLWDVWWDGRVAVVGGCVAGVGWEGGFGGVAVAFSRYV